jgi:hypothetical protein
VLFFDRGRIGLVARQPNRFVVTEPERGVIPAVEVDRPHRQVRPLRELLGNEPAD